MKDKAESGIRQLKYIIKGWCNILEVPMWKDAGENARGSKKPMLDPISEIRWLPDYCISKGMKV